MVSHRSKLRTISLAWRRRNELLPRQGPRAPSNRAPQASPALPPQRNAAPRTLPRAAKPTRPVAKRRMDRRGPISIPTIPVPRGRARRRSSLPSRPRIAGRALSRSQARSREKKEAASPRLTRRPRRRSPMRWLLRRTSFIRREEAKPRPAALASRILAAWIPSARGRIS